MEFEKLGFNTQRIIIFREELSRDGRMTTKLMLKPGEGVIFTTSGIPKIYTSDEVENVVKSEQDDTQFEAFASFDPVEKRIEVNSKNNAVTVDVDHPFDQLDVGDEILYLVIWGANSYDAESFFHFVYYGDDDI